MQRIKSSSVSVIIPSHRDIYIDELIFSFTKEVCGSIPIEIIIIADYTVNSYREKYGQIKWIHIPDKSISKKRNKGIMSATGDICAFIDDDCIPEKGWVPAAIKYLQLHPEMAGVEGITSIVPCEEKQGSYREFKRLENRGFRTNNIFYKKKILLEVAMFDERFSVQREDVDLAYTILEAGFTIGYSQDIHVKHRYRNNENWDLLKNCVNRRFDPLLFKKHEKLYRQYIKSPYPPGISILSIVYFLTILLYKFFKRYLFIGILTDIVTVALLTIRRAGVPNLNNRCQWLREYVSFGVSPVVLSAALLYGVLGFKKFSLLSMLVVSNPIYNFFERIKKGKNKF
ncbi:MAG: glycosyltransferase [Chitinispirillia bacterium]